MSSEHFSRKNLYIIGARGFGRELAGEYLFDEKFRERYDLKGFLDDKSDALDRFDGKYPPIVGAVETWKPGPDDVFVCALGAPQYRKKYVEIMLARGGKFINWISSNVSLYPTATLGVGCILCSNVLVRSDAVVGDYALLHPNVVVGHDIHIGPYSVLESGVVIGGFTRIGSETVIHTGAKVSVHLNIGDRAEVGIGSTVIRDVPSESIVFGNPARQLLRPRESK